MKPAARVGDSCGGTIVTGANSVMIEGMAAAHIGSFVSPHPYGDHIHVVRIVTGSDSVYVEGKPLAQMGDMAGCGVHRITTAANGVGGG
jgi:uncharacterized Zn-binding protein involved in type VI secretion